MADNKEKIDITVYTFGLDDVVRQTVDGMVTQGNVIHGPVDIEKMMEPLDPVPSIILCGQPPEGVTLVEIAQTLRMQYQTQPIYYVCRSKVGYDRKVFIKNGFTEAYLLPLDNDLLKKNINDLLSQISSGKIKSFRPVKILDLEAGVQLNFDTTIFLPANKKYIKYSSSGDPLDQKQIEKLKTHQMNSLYVESQDMQKFYDYTSSRLKAIGQSTTLSATEKKEKLESSVRHLMSNLFIDNSQEATFEQGQNMVKDCQEIVKTFIMSSSNSDWYEQLMARVGDIGNNYSHHANVSTYAALFAIGIGMPNPEELAIAGLLHDVGLSELPPEVIGKKEEERTPEEQELYKKHPELSVELIKKRKLIVSEKVMKAILQHHECFNGTGYPKGFAGTRICKEAQILALADKFDYLTTVREGETLVSPRQAVEYFRNEMASDPSKMIFDPELLQQILKLFPEEEKAQGAVAA